MKIQERAMLVSLSIGKFSPKKTDKKATKEVIEQHQATDDAGKFIKQILPKESLDALKQVESEARTYYYSRTHAWTDDGARILPSALYMEFTDKFRGFNRQWEPLVEDFMSRLDAMIQTQRGRLQGLFNEADYPDRVRIKSKFTFTTSFLPFPSGEDFRCAIPEEELAALNVKTEARIQEVEKAACADLWKRLAEPLQTMARNLGNPKGKVYDTVISNVQDIFRHQQKCRRRIGGNWNIRIQLKTFIVVPQMSRITSYRKIRAAACFVRRIHRPIRTLGVMRARGGDHMSAG
jgi:hypothetical protein